MDNQTPHRDESVPHLRSIHTAITEMHSTIARLHQSVDGQTKTLEKATEYVAKNIAEQTRTLAEMEIITRIAELEAMKALVSEEEKRLSEEGVSDSEALDELRRHFQESAAQIAALRNKRVRQLAEPAFLLLEQDLEQRLEPSVYQLNDVLEVCFETTRKSVEKREQVLREVIEETREAIQLFVEKRKKLQETITDLQINPGELPSSPEGTVYGVPFYIVEIQERSGEIRHEIVLASEVVEDVEARRALDSYSGPLRHAIASRVAGILSALRKQPARSLRTNEAALVEQSLPPEERRRFGFPSPQAILQGREVMLVAGDAPLAPGQRRPSATPSAARSKRPGPGTAEPPAAPTGSPDRPSGVTTPPSYPSGETAPAPGGTPGPGGEDTAPIPTPTAAHEAVEPEAGERPPQEAHQPPQATPGSRQERSPQAAPQHELPDGTGGNELPESSPSSHPGDDLRAGTRIPGPEPVEVELPAGTPADGSGTPEAQAEKEPHVTPDSGESEIAPPDPAAAPGAPETVTPEKSAPTSAPPPGTEDAEASIPTPTALQPTESPVRDDGPAAGMDEPAAASQEPPEEPAPDPGRQKLDAAVELMEEGFHREAVVLLEELMTEGYAIAEVKPLRDRCLDLLEEELETEPAGTTVPEPSGEDAETAPDGPGDAGTDDRFARAVALASDGNVREAVLLLEELIAEGLGDERVHDLRSVCLMELEFEAEETPADGPGGRNA